MIHGYGVPPPPGPARRHSSRTHLVPSALKTRFPAAERQPRHTRSHWCGSRTTLGIEISARSRGQTHARPSLQASVIAGITGWRWVDPAVGIAIGLWIVPRTLRLGGRALRILVQAAPPSLDLDRVATDLAGVPGVVDVHDLHVWTLTSEMEVASAHLMVRAGTDAHSVLDQARDVLRAGYGIDHATLQVEPDDHLGCHDVTW